MNENQLLYQQLVSGDRKAIKAIYLSLESKLGYWLKNNKGNAKDARDILHEAVAALIISSHIKSVKPPSNVEGYIFTICKYKWYDELKSRKSKNEVINVEELTHMSEGTIQDTYIQMEADAQKHKVLNRSFSKLTELCQQLLSLVKQGLKSKEIAVQLDMSNDATVNRRKFACMEAWKKNLYADYEYKRILNDV